MKDFNVLTLGLSALKDFSITTVDARLYTVCRNLGTSNSKFPIMNDGIPLSEHINFRVSDKTLAECRNFSLGGMSKVVYGHRLTIIVMSQKETSSSSSTQSQVQSTCALEVQG